MTKTKQEAMYDQYAKQDLIYELHTLETEDDRLWFQMSTWLKGISIHNTIDDCCTPDYACCHPKLASSIRCRAVFLNAANKQNLKLVYEMNINFEVALEIALKREQISLDEYPAKLEDYH